MENIRFHLDMQGLDPSSNAPGDFCILAEQAVRPTILRIIQNLLEVMIHGANKRKYFVEGVYVSLMTIVRVCATCGRVSTTMKWVWASCVEIIFCLSKVDSEPESYMFLDAFEELKCRLMSLFCLSI